MPMTKDEFYKHPNIASVRSQIRDAGILCYVVAGISLVLPFLSGNPFGALLDVLLIVGLGLGIQLGKSRVCAIILTVYGAFNTIIITLANSARRMVDPPRRNLCDHLYFQISERVGGIPEHGNCKRFQPGKEKIRVSN